MLDKLWRIEGSGTRIWPISFEVISETKCGHWIKDDCEISGKRFVLKTARKRHAYPTELEAYNALIYRRMRANTIMNRRIHENNDSIKEAKRKIDELSATI